MYGCSQLVGVQINDLLESIRKTTYTLVSYKTLASLASTVMERNMLIHMQMEDTYILSTLTKVYIILTGLKPVIPLSDNKIVDSYIGGIEAVLLENLQIAKTLTTLYLSTEVKYLSGLFINFFSLKCVQATNLNYILLTNKISQS